MSDDIDEWLQTKPPRSVNNRITPYLQRMAIQKLAESQGCYVNEYGFYTPIKPERKPPIVAFYACLGIIATGVAALMLLRADDHATISPPSRHTTKTPQGVVHVTAPNFPYGVVHDAILSKLPVSPDSVDFHGDRLGTVVPGVRHRAVRQDD